MTLLGVGLVAAGAVGGVLAGPEPVPTSLGAAGTPSVVTVPVSSQSFDGKASAKVTPTVSEGTTLQVADQGRVTRSSCRTGGTIASGTSPLRVEDRPVIALATKVPLWRDLKVGMKGDDVAALQAELARLGYTDAAADGTYGPGTKAAWSTLQSKVGAKPTGAVAVASVMWLPAAKVTVSECTVKVGSSATADAAKVAGQVTGLKLELPEGTAPGSRVASLASSDVTAKVGKDLRITDAEFLAAVLDDPLFSVSQDEDGVPFTLTTTLATPLEVAAVAPGAVRAIKGSQGCVVVPDAAPAAGQSTTGTQGESTPAEGGRAVQVTVVSSALGRSYVTFDGPTPAAVLVGGPGVDGCR